MDQLDIPIGGQSMVILPGLGTAGYRWSAAVDDPAVVRCERQVAEAVAGPVLPGRSLNERFLLTATSAGETIVRFLQARSFEPSKPPIATREVRVVVTSTDSR